MHVQSGTYRSHKRIFLRVQAFAFVRRGLVSQVIAPSLYSEATKTLTIVVPAYNESRRISPMLDEALDYLQVPELCMKQPDAVFPTLKGLTYRPLRLVHTADWLGMNITLMKPSEVLLSTGQTKPAGSALYLRGHCSGRRKLR